jgi:L-rhamnose-H+ transport protein
MEAQLGWGIALVVLGGFLNGSFFVPMKRMPMWRWENTWLIYSLIAMIIAPWGAAMATVPHLTAVFHDTGWPTLIWVALFGLGWGIGSTLFGVGVTRVGMGLGFGIILGITAAVGSLVPMVVLHPEQLHTSRGYTVMAGIVLVILGTVFCGIAGQRRELEKSAKSSGGRHAGFGLGLVICILSGIFSPMLNFSFVFGQPLQQKSLAAGAALAVSTYPIWAVALSAGFLANAVYCSYLLRKNRTWPVYWTSGAPRSYLLGAAAMGFLWFGGVAAYGMGATAMGGLGGVIGWPVFVAMNILTGNFWGAATGEWAGTSRSSYAYLWAGICALLIAIFVISRGGAA